MSFQHTGESSSMEVYSISSSVLNNKYKSHNPFQLLSEIRFKHQLLP